MINKNHDDKYLYKKYYLKNLPLDSNLINKRISLIENVTKKFDFMPETHFYPYEDYILELLHNC